MKVLLAREIDRLVRDIRALPDRSQRVYRRMPAQQEVA